MLSAEALPTYRLNIDKGNQAQSGKEAVVIGTVGNLSGTETWELKELERCERSAHAAVTRAERASIFG